MFTEAGDGFAGQIARVLADDLEAADARGDLIEVDALDQPSVLN